MSARVTIHELEEADLPDVCRFHRAQTSGESGSEATTAASVEHHRWYLFDNPEARADLPKGLIARDAEGQIVGMKHCSPQRFQCAGEEFLLLLGGGYYVSAAHRGVGLRLMRAFLETSDRVSQFASTMNEVSGAIYERYGGYPIPDTEHEMIGVLRWRPFVEEVLARRVGRPGLARWAALPTIVAPSRVRRRHAGRLHPIDGPEALRLDGIGSPPEHAKQITAARNPSFLRWRYLEGPATNRQVFFYEHPDGRRAFVAVSLGRRGHRGQIRALTVLDYWGALPQSAVRDVSSALALRFRAHADVIVWRGQPPERQAELGAAGFMRRPLVRAIGVCIDREGRLPTRDWYMVPADGDMSL